MKITNIKNPEVERGMLAEDFPCGVLGRIVSGLNAGHIVYKNSYVADKLLFVGCDNCFTISQCSDLRVERISTGTRVTIEQE